MKTLFWIFGLVMATMMWSCEGKRADAVRAERPDTMVLKAGPDSLVAQIGAGSTADRLQLVLKFQSAYPDTIVVALPAEVMPEKESAGFAAGQMVVVNVSRLESGDYVLHSITDVTDAYQKACESYVGTWATADSVAMQLTIEPDGKVELKNAPKWHYGKWQFFNCKFSGILLKGTGVCDTARVADGKLTFYSHQGKTRQKWVLERNTEKAQRSDKPEPARRDTTSPHTPQTLTQIPI
ncbi:MAG: hypothetical protein ACI30R_08835 [Sodaliphilus sp.]